MERKTYLSRYRLCVERDGSPMQPRTEAGKTVYKAEEIASGREVSLEVVSSVGLRATVLEKLEAEARAALQLNHVNIPRLIDFGSEGEVIYVTEYFDGTTADAWIAAHGPMPVAAVLRIAMQVVGALGAAAFHGIYHYAFTPREVMLVPGQTAEGDWPLIKVLNLLGVAPTAATSQPVAHQTADASHFTSPEQAQSGTADFRSELYSLGCTLWFLLTGTPPVDGRATVESTSGVPAAVRHLVAQLIATDPTERPLDPLALQRQIQSCLAQVERRDAVASKIGLPPVVVKRRTERSPRSRFPLKPLALAGLLLGIAILAALVLPERFRPSRLSGAEQEPIGIPIGVPETSTEGSLTQAESTDASETSSQPPMEPAKIASAGNLTSDVPVPGSAAMPSQAYDEVSAPENASGPADATQSANVESNSVPPGGSHTIVASPATANEDVPSVAANSAPRLAQADVPAPRAGGPNQTESASPPPSAQELNSMAQTSGEPEKEAVATPATSPPVSSPRVVQRTDGSSAETTRGQPDGRNSSAKSPPRSIKKGRTAAADNMPPLPRGSVRAQYLGTTAEGELVFGLPSHEQGFIAPRESSRENSSRRSPGRTVKNPDELPVLPALPPVLPALPPDE